MSEMPPDEYIDCRKCRERNTDCQPIKSYRKPGTRKIMLIGQDPTIRKKQERINSSCALMLDKTNGSLHRWIIKIFGEDNFNKYNIYATNAIKCVLQKVATDHGNGGYNYLEPIFENCKFYLANEIEQFKPEYIFTFGEPCYRLFSHMISNGDKINKKFSTSFGEDFIRITFRNHTFLYSPVLHIQTYHVADKYGEKVKRFEELIKSI